MALDYVLHALDLLDRHLHQCCKVSTESSLLSSPANELRQPMSSARLHYLAARLFMSLNDPSEASVHLKIASSQTKFWPSLQLSIQRALIACADRHESLSKEYDPPSTSSVLPNAIDVKDSCIEILLHPEKCKLLSLNEAKNVQGKAWKDEPTSNVERALEREIIWTQYDSSKSVSPFEFAVSFLGSTHATSGDSVPACVSIKSHVGFPVIIASIQLITSSGLYEVPNNDCCVEESALRRLMQKSNLTSKDNCDLGSSFEPNDLKFFFTEISLPEKLSDVLVGDTSSDISTFTPKNCRLCNMGFSHAGKILSIGSCSTLMRVISYFALFLPPSGQHLRKENRKQSSTEYNYRWEACTLVQFIKIFVVLSRWNSMGVHWSCLDLEKH